MGSGGAGIAVGGRQHLGDPLGGQSTHRFDAGPELIRAGRSDRRSAADAAQLVVNPAVRLARSMVCHGHQRVQFAAQVPQLPVPGHRLGDGGSVPAATVKLLTLAAQASPWVAESIWAIR